MSGPLADLAVGTALPEQVYRVTRADLVRYAGASGDFNPIHWNERVATSVGLPGVIAHGMFTMALAGRAVTDWTGDPGALLEFQVRFGRPVARPGRRFRRRGHRPRHRGRPARGLPGPRRPHRHQRRGEGAVAGPRRRPRAVTRRLRAAAVAAAVLLLPACTSFAETTAPGPAAEGTAEPSDPAARPGRRGGLPRRAGRTRSRPPADQPRHAPRGRPGHRHGHRDGRVHP